MGKSDLRPLRALIVEDSALDYTLLVRLLGNAGYEVTAKRVETGPDFSAALSEGAWDVIISDHNLPEFSSTEALKLLQASALDIPFIIVSGQIGEDVAVDAMIAGADDYVLKSNLSRLAPSLHRSLEAAAVRRHDRAMQQALADSEQRLRELSSHLEHAKEEERKAVAREIHDDIGGLLTGLKFDVAWMQRHAHGDGVAERLDGMLKLVTSAREAADRIMRELRPAILEQGIVAALEWQARDFTARYGLPCRFTHNRDVIPLPAVSCSAMFRICQESLTNIAKHSKASEVRIELFADDDDATLEIHDNGAGIAPGARSKRGSWGLIGMQERAKALGGWLDVSSAPGAGTTIMLSLPMKESAG